MKRCPKCNTDYFDNILEFCLEDGERLLELSKADKEIETVSSMKQFDKKTEAETVTLNEKAYVTNKADKLEDPNLQAKFTDKSEKFKETAAKHWLKLLEFIPIILAIFHNYWQWLYFEKLSYYNLFDFLTNGVFLFWLLLLILGTVTGIFALKFSKYKGFAIVALTMLAINLILSIVPK